MQVHTPRAMHYDPYAPSDEQRTKRAAWFPLLAALMTQQPASHQISMTVLWSAELPAAQVLAPWITKLHITMDRKDDIGKVLKASIEVGQCSLSRMRFSVSEHQCLFTSLLPALNSLPLPIAPICPQNFPRLRQLEVFSESESTVPHAFTSVEWPEDGVRYPAMDTLSSLVVTEGYNSSPVLLPPIVDLRKISSLSRVTLLCTLYSKGDEVQLQQVLKLQPHVTVTDLDE
jgi:hypothetical protein